MKKTVLLLTVCLVLGLCACGLRGQSTAGNTVEPVHFSARRSARTRPRRNSCR